MNAPHSSPASLTPDTRTLKRALLFFSQCLERAGVDSPRLSAEMLLAKALGISRQALVKECILTPQLPLAEETVRIAWELVRRRAQGEPAAYIMGGKEFYGRDFLVTPAVLIPRPETELLVDTALTLMDTLAPSLGRLPRSADFGTGSGCIAVTMTLERPGLVCAALDKSEDALKVARANARALGAQNVVFARADFTAPPLPEQSLDLLLSNPPYVTRREYEGLSPEVRCFEPKTALTPDDDAGLDALDAVTAQARSLLRPGGWLVMEMGAGQGEAVQSMLHEARFGQTRLIRDLAGLPRIFAAQKQP